MHFQFHTKSRSHEEVELLAPQGLNVSNRRWSARATSAEPADRHTHKSSPTGTEQGAVVVKFSPCRADGRGGGYPPVPLAPRVSPTVIHIQPRWGSFKFLMENLG